MYTKAETQNQFISGMKGGPVPLIGTPENNLHELYTLPIILYKLLSYIGKETFEKLLLYIHIRDRLIRSHLSSIRNQFKIA